jgi:TolB protein
MSEPTIQKSWPPTGGGRRPGPAPTMGRRIVRAGTVLLAGILALSAPATTPTAWAGTFPGGNGQLAFAHEDASGVDIFTMNPDGSHVRRFINTPTGSASVFGDWSPDGRRLAFDSDRSGNVEIYLATRDGDIRRLTRNPADDVHPTWTPDGRHLAFESNRSGIPQVYVMKVDGSHVRKVTRIAGGAIEPAYSPTGQWITFVAGPERRTSLYVVRPDGSDLRRLTPPSMNAGHPSWSPDGRTIVFNSNFEKPNGRIWTVRLNGSLRQLTRGSDGLEDFEAAYSPNGDLIAFTRFRGGPENADIWVMQADGSRARNLTPRLAGFDVGVTWAPRRR